AQPRRRAGAAGRAGAERRRTAAAARGDKADARLEEAPSGGQGKALHGQVDARRAAPFAGRRRLGGSGLSARPDARRWMEAAGGERASAKMRIEGRMRTVDSIALGSQALGADLQAAKRQVLRDAFGFTGFRDGQEAVVDTVLAGGNALAVMPTGAGKSLCYQLPALVLGGLTIVVSPLIALMDDQVAALTLAGQAAGAIHSGRSREDNVAVWKRAASGELRLLYLSPERLMSERMLAALGRLPVRLIAVDEAH